MREASVQVSLDGELVELSPRLAEMVRRLVEVDAMVSQIQVGDVTLHFADRKVSMAVRWSMPSRRLPGE